MGVKSKNKDKALVRTLGYKDALVVVTKNRSNHYLKSSLAPLVWGG